MPWQLGPAFEGLRLRFGLESIPQGYSQALFATLPHAGDVETPGALTALLARHAEDVSGVRPLDVASPVTMPRMAQVYILRHEGEPRYVLKVFPDFGALLRETGALWHVGKQPHSTFELPALVATGTAKVGSRPCAFLVTRCLGRADLLHLGATTSPSNAEYLRYLHHAGAALRSLHTAFPPSRDERCIEIRRTEHVDYVRNLTGSAGYLAQVAARGWLSASTAQDASARIAALADAYAAAPRRTLPLGVAHGDAYPANFVVHLPEGRLGVVDLETLMWSFGPERGTSTGIADVREDVGRFVESLNAYGTEIDNAPVAAFLDGYFAAVPDRLRAPLMEHHEFFRLRYDAVILRAFLAGHDVRLDGDQMRQLVRSMVERLTR